MGYQGQLFAATRSLPQLNTVNGSRPHSHRSSLRFLQSRTPHARVEAGLAGTGVEAGCAIPGVEAGRAVRGSIMARVMPGDIMARAMPGSLVARRAVSVVPMAAGHRRLLREIDHDPIVIFWDSPFRLRQSAVSLSG